MFFFPNSGQAIKNEIQQSYNFLDPPTFLIKNVEESLRSPWDPYFDNVPTTRKSMLVYGAKNGK